LPPSPSHPPLPFSSDAVYYFVDCSSGGSINYSGTLPGWITIDKSNSQLVGAAGTYRASSKSQANTAAQSALDGFADAAIADGSLSCSVCDATAAQVVLSTISTNANTVYLYGSAYAPNQKLLFVGESGNTDAADARIFVIDTTTDTLSATLQVTNGYTVGDIVYSPAQDKLYAVVIAKSGNNIIAIIDPAALTVTPYVMTTNVIGVRGATYDSLRDAVYFCREGGAVVVGKFDCATAMQTADIYINAIYTSGLLAYCPTNDKIYVGTQFTDVLVLDPATFLLDTTVSIPVLGIYHGVDFLGYSSLSDAVYCQHYAHSGVHIIDPSTNTVAQTYTPSGFLWGVADNTCINQVATTYDTDFVFVDPTSRITQTTLAADYGSSITYCPDNTKTYLAEYSPNVAVIGPSP
jgi:hypothetical protein